MAFDEILATGEEGEEERLIEAMKENANITRLAQIDFDDHRCSLLAGH